MNNSEWNEVIMNDNIDNFLKNVFDEEQFNVIKNEKQQLLMNEPIFFKNNSEVFLKKLIQNDFNFCIVTNTNKETVKIFKEKLPLLNDIKQWVYRNDYILPKPNSECYEKAKLKYYKNEKYIIGFEDSMVGYKSLKTITDVIYIFDNDSIFKTNDCYIFDDYLNIK